MTQPIKLTDAQTQAYVLQAVAAHQFAFPNLPHVSISPFKVRERFRLQVCSPQGRDLDGLLQWAGTLAADQVYVVRPGGQCHLHVYARLIGLVGWGHGYAVPLDVWSEVPELAGAPLAAGDVVPVADLILASARAVDIAGALAEMWAGGRG